MITTRMWSLITHSLGSITYTNRSRINQLQRTIGNCLPLHSALNPVPSVTGPYASQRATGDLISSTLFDYHLVLPCVWPLKINVDLMYHHRYKEIGRWLSSKLFLLENITRAYFLGNGLNHSKKIWKNVKFDKLRWA